MDPVPDYDTTDEIEYFMSWFPWSLRVTDWTGTPAYPPVFSPSHQFAGE